MVLYHPLSETKKPAYDAKEYKPASYHYEWNVYKFLSKVQNVLCPDGVYRTFYPSVLVEAGDELNARGGVQINKRYVTGNIRRQYMNGIDVTIFYPDPSSRNAYLFDEYEIPQRAYTCPYCQSILPPGFVNYNER